MPSQIRPSLLPAVGPLKTLAGHHPSHRRSPLFLPPLLLPWRSKIESFSATDEMLMPIRCPEPALHPGSASRDAIVDRVPKIIAIADEATQMPSLPRPSILLQC
ncbi:hypothetical protein J5N97_000030 [Dioscorea zingiberensis]|uniref:Uncharacterized protein n=1 Tax=Dioscorea zingiberensis TaxID=325984 RepID=A0A9D5H3E6_9LILI|nr:hypothetical protein J5N97_000030 [Dioscorea zingiberensis]